MQIPLFPDNQDPKWSEYQINVTNETKIVMEEIISKTSLIRLSDLQTIEKILRKYIKE